MKQKKKTTKTNSSTTTTQPTIQPVNKKSPHNTHPPPQRSTTRLTAAQRLNIQTLGRRGAVGGLPVVPTRGRIPQPGYILLDPTVVSALSTFFFFHIFIVLGVNLLVQEKANKHNNNNNNTNNNRNKKKKQSKQHGQYNTQNMNKNKQ